MKDGKSVGGHQDDEIPKANAYTRSLLLLQQVDRVVNFLPSSVLTSVIDLLQDSPCQYNEALVAKLLGNLPNPKFRRVVAELFSIWHRN